MNNRDITNKQASYNYKQAVLEATKKNPYHNNIVVYGYHFNKENWIKQIERFWTEDIPIGVLNCSQQLQIDYGINTWKMDTDYYIIGHADYTILQKLIDNTDQIKDTITTINWYIVPMIDDDTTINNIKIITNKNNNPRIKN
jgi:hypothetical protein